MPGAHPFAPCERVGTTGLESIRRLLQQRYLCHRFGYALKLSHWRTAVYKPYPFVELNVVEPPAVTVPLVELNK